MKRDKTGCEYRVIKSAGQTSYDEPCTCVAKSVVRGKRYCREHAINVKHTKNPS